MRPCSLFRTGETSLPGTLEMSPYGSYGLPFHSL